MELYRHAGVRSVEIGSVMFGAKARHELLRLAIPRRVYTQSHIDYLVEAILEVNDRREQIRGFEIVSEPQFLAALHREIPAPVNRSGLLAAAASAMKAPASESAAVEAAATKVRRRCDAAASSESATGKAHARPNP